MRVGLDFDNTIVSYDALFHRVACEGGWVDASLPPSKLSVRDHLRRIGKEEVWTEMQGLVYGARMAEAECFPGALAFMRWARGQGVELAIVSHKTRHPFLGPKYDLHEAARRWIAATLRDERGALVDPDKVFFELTKEEKCARVKALGCAFFVDDLPEMLTAAGFPREVEAVLFDPDGHHAGSALKRVRNWDEVKSLVESQWQHSR